MALGEMAMNPDEFWQMPIPLYNYKLNGHLNRETRTLFLLREQLVKLHNVNVAKEEDMLTGSEIFPLYGEKKKPKKREPRPEKWSEEEMADLARRMNQ